MSRSKKPNAARTSQAPVREPRPTLPPPKRRKGLLLAVSLLLLLWIAFLVAMVLTR